jgi:hypothetical protein
MFDNCCPDATSGHLFSILIRVDLRWRIVRKIKFLLLEGIGVAGRSLGL